MTRSLKAAQCTAGSSAFFGTPPAVDQKLKAATSTVLSRLCPSPDESPPPIRSITLILEEFDGVAYTCGSKLDEEHKEVHLSLSYLADVQKNAKSDSNRVANEVMGVLVHELVHAFQFNGKGTVPGGVIEGIADWLRGEAGLAPPHWREQPGEDDRWDAGYERTVRATHSASTREAYACPMRRAISSPGYPDTSATLPSSLS